MNVPKAFYRGPGNTDGTNLITVPANKIWIVTNVIVVNASANSLQAYVKIDGFHLLYNMTLAPSGIFTLDCAQPVAATKALQAWSATANALSVHISGVEVNA